MPTIKQRIMQEGAAFARRLSSRPNARVREQIEQIRSQAYTSDADQRDMLLSGRIYLKGVDGGARREVLRVLGRDENESKYPIVPHFNPVPEIVGFYANALGGSLGTDLIAIGKDKLPVPEQLMTPIQRVWRWSNLDSRLDAMTVLAANQGTVGIRTTYTDNGSPRVFLEMDDPRMFSRPPEVDARGNVLAVYLKYYGVTYQDDDSPITVEVEERITEDEFSLTYDGVEQFADEQRSNVLGFCPYVLLNHRAVPGSSLGAHAYEGSEPTIHAINFALSQLDESELAHVWPYIFATSPAERPTRLTAGKYTLLFSKTREGMPTPTFNPMVPDIDFEAVVKFAAQRVDWMREKHPQMILNAIKAMAGLSGETLQQALRPAAAESKRARSIYETALIRAVEMAISVGIFNRIDGFDLGTGVGSIEAIDAAYGDGEGPSSFRFAERPYLPMTPIGMVQQAQADNAPQMERLKVSEAAAKVGLPRSEQWRLGGYTEEQIRKMTAEADADAARVAELQAKAKPAVTQ